MAAMLGAVIRRKIRVLKAFFIGIPHRFFFRWIFLAICIGIVVGFTVTIFHFTVEWLSEILLEEVPEKFHIPYPYVFLIVTPIGCGLAGLIAQTMASEIKGSGTKQMLEAYHEKLGLTRKRVPFLKFIASAFTISSGGSAGYEGPMVQIGGGLGSIVAHELRLRVLERRVLMLAGVAAAIGSVFRAPLSGAFFAVELPYVYDVEVVALLPCVLASAISYSIYASFVGWEPRFHTLQLEVTSIEELGLYAIEGVFLGFIAILYSVIFEKISHMFEKTKLPLPIRCALGGFLTGLIGVFYPEVMGLGYDTIEETLLEPKDMERLFIITILKIIATSLTVGSGASGGLLAPAIFIGTTAGGSIGLLFKDIVPELVDHPSKFALVGLGAFIAGAAKTPLTAISLVGELSGNYKLLVPLMIATSITFTMSGRVSLMEYQVRDRSKSPLGKLAEMNLNGVRQ